MHLCTYIYLCYTYESKLFSHYAGDHEEMAAQKFSRTFFYVILIQFTIIYTQEISVFVQSGDHNAFQIFCCWYSSCICVSIILYIFCCPLRRPSPVQIDYYVHLRTPEHKEWIYGVTSKRVNEVWATLVFPLSTPGENTEKAVKDLQSVRRFRRIHFSSMWNSRKMELIFSKNSFFNHIYLTSPEALLRYYHSVLS